MGISGSAIGVLLVSNIVIYMYCYAKTLLTDLFQISRERTPERRQKRTERVLRHVRPLIADCLHLIISIS